MSGKEFFKKSGNKQAFVFNDFKDWNMYKNYLAYKGNLQHGLDFRVVDWQGYLKVSGKKPD